MSVEHSSSLVSHIVDLKMILCTKKVLVDSLADLPCLSYHFDNEIEEVSKHAFERREDLIANENDLHTVSIIFRVFRTYGDYVLSDIFNIFKGNSGKFKKSLVEDVKGMLSFYEAMVKTMKIMRYQTTTDHILDEASSLTLDHLKPLATGRGGSIKGTGGCRACPPHILKYAKSSPHISVPEQPSSGCKGQYYLL
uniref:Terpene synthase N-terminal domain-containing protein n=1 Tax=Brassica oleracea TaxID=3712 RepID=A0A3P6ENH1_BRAOL|nr:unnamed protein product [Brassica oleracea]